MAANPVSLMWTRRYVASVTGPGIYTYIYRSINVETQLCGECHGPLQLQEKTPRSTRTPNAFAAFISQHFHAAKRV